MALSREDVLACLKQIKAPSGVDLVEAGLVRALTVEDDKVRFVMEVDSPDPFKAAKDEAESNQGRGRIEVDRAGCNRSLYRDDGA